MRDIGDWCLITIFKICLAHVLSLYIKFFGNLDCLYYILVNHCDQRSSYIHVSACLHICILIDNAD